jgi:hypothetical protein
MRLVCATHGHCFDGLASAVIFTRLASSLEPKLEFEYFGCGYGVGQRRPSQAMFDGDENAILDYRFDTATSLTWFFDHHRTAFLDEEHRRVFESRKSSGRYFYDPEYSSCTKLIADVAKAQFSLPLNEFSSLIHWADVIDAARFESAQQAANREHPVLKMASVVEHFGDDKLLTELVGQLLVKPLGEVARDPKLQERYAPLGERHERFLERVRLRSEKRGRVILCDLTDSVVDVMGKFSTYALYPQSEYSVIVGLLSNGVKISVGFNPWAGTERHIDISAICARWGGGGHPFVGGISFEKSQLETARKVAAQIADELA